MSDDAPGGSRDGQRRQFRIQSPALDDMMAAHRSRFADQFRDIVAAQRSQLRIQSPALDDMMAAHRS
ncbi:hypothetical protein E0H26_28975, partial [Micromonospora zingiberis]